jgi:hypothetical protein
MKDREFHYNGLPAKVCAIDEQTNNLFIRREGRLIEKNYHDFLKDVQDQTVIFTRSLAKPLNRSGATEKQVLKIARLEAYFYEMHKYGNPTTNAQHSIDIVSVRIKDKKPPSRSTLCKGFKLWREHGYDASVQVLCNRKTFPNRLSPEIELFMDRSIGKNYLTRKGPSAVHSYGEFCKEFDKKGYEPSLKPSIRTFQRRIKKLNPFDVVSARKGISEAKKKFRKVLNKFNVEFPLERVELDSAHFNIGLIEIRGDKKYYIGSVSTDLAFDAATGSLLGYCHHVGDKAEKSEYIISMLSHCINQKPDPSYIQFGLPQKIVMDAGVGYRSEMTRAYLDAIGCEYETTPTRRPWSKPFVERFVKHLRDNFFSATDGYLGKYNPEVYTDLTLKKAAFLTIEQFHQKFADFVRKYHETPRDNKDDLSPNDAWIEGTKIYPPQTVSDLAELSKYKPLKISNRTLNLNRGLTHLGQWFNSDELTNLRSRIAHISNTKKILIDILVDPNNASSISVLLPESLSREPGTIEMIEVPNIDRSKHGKSFAQIQAVKSKPLQNNGAHVYVNYDNVSGYGKKPKVGDTIEIVLSNQLTVTEREEELSEMLAVRQQINAFEEVIESNVPANEDYCGGELYGN